MLVLRQLLQLVIVVARGERADAVEVLVLRHQVAVLHRQVRGLDLEPADRAVLAGLSRLLPGVRRAAFFATPATVRRECLDRILIYNTRHLLAVLRGYLAYHNGHRAHQGRGQCPPDRERLPPPVTELDTRRIRRRKIFGGLVNEYFHAA